MRKKIKFELYRVHFKGHNYESLIPLVTDQLWITYYGNKHWGSMWDGNRQSLEFVMYAAVFYVFSRRIFQSMYLSFNKFLERDLETEFLENKFAPSEGISTGYTNYFAYRERLQQTQYMEMGFMDIGRDKKRSRERERKKRG